MPNLLDFLRMRNIFGQPDMIGNDLPSQGGITGNMNVPPMMGGPSSDPWGNIQFGPNRVMAPQAQADPAPMVQADQMQDYDVGKRMSELYHPETAASDRFNQLASAYPDREANRPGKLRTIAGALMALSSGMAPGRGMNFYHANPQGIQAGLNFADEPYQEAIQNWKNQIVPAQQAASDERYRNTNERTLAYQTVANELRQHAQDAKDRNDQRKLDISEARAKVYEFKAHNPGAKFDFSGPTVKVADPITKEIKDTGIPTGHMSELDKMNLQGEQRIEQIQEGGSQARQTEGVRQQGREAIAETRGWKPYEETLPDGTKRTFMYNEITGETRDRVGKSSSAAPVSRSGAGNKPETPTQTRVRQFNAARELYNTRPDLRPYIKLGSPGANDFSITPPKDSSFFGYGMHSGPQKAQLEEINTYIYGSPEGEAPKPVAAHGPSATPAPSQGNVIKQYSPSRNQTRISNDGGKTWTVVQGRQ